MEQPKLQTIIKEKNEALEREALRRAESIIGTIAAEQADIKKSQNNIVKLRQELMELNVESLDPTEILGE